MIVPDSSPKIITRPQVRKKGNCAIWKYCAFGKISERRREKGPPIAQRKRVVALRIKWFLVKWLAE